MRAARSFLAAVLAAGAVVVASVSPTTHARSPEERAEPPGITWWALGDSYSSGEGLRYNDFSANPPDANCERATGASSVGAASKAYSVVARDQLTGIDEFRLVACTGAITNQWRGQWQETGSTRADLVTLSFGGNNIGFSDVVMSCIGVSIEGGFNAAVGGSALWALNPALGCNASREDLDERVDMLVGNGPDPHQAYDQSQTLPDMYAEIAASAVNPGGHVVVLGYPNLVEESGKWTWRLLAGNRCHRIRRADANMLRGATGYLNQQIALAVEAANANAQGVQFHFVDVSKIYENETGGHHGLCTGEPWLNGLTVGVAGPDDNVVPFRLYRSFHPNQIGHDKTGAALVDVIRSLDWSKLANSAEVDRSVFAGTWSGSISGPNGPFKAVVALGANDGLLRGTIEHPDLPCFGTTIETALSGDQVILETTYTADSNCIRGGIHRFTASGDGELLYEWLAPGSARIDSGTLKRVADGNMAPPGEAGITPTGGGRSTYSSTYYADVTAVRTIEGSLIEVDFAATGGDDLRRPETVCLVSDIGAVATPVRQVLATDQPGDFRGTWTFPLIREGRWSLLYSCRTDYSAVPVADVTVADIGVSIYSDEYYATVFSASRIGASTIQVRFASHGNERSQNDLRDPKTSCVVVNGKAYPAASASYTASYDGQYYDGTLEFDGVPAGSVTFLYSCQNDYGEVELGL